MHALRCLCCVCVHALCCMHCTVYTMLYVLYCICCMDCAVSLYVCMYVCMEEPGSWTNIPSCLSFLRYVLCKHHGPGYKLLARDLRLFPSLVFTEYPLQILSAWCQCHVCSAARRDSTHNKVKWMVWVQTNTERVHIMYNDLSIFHQTVPRSVTFFGGTVITLNTFFGCHSLTDLWLLTWARVTFYYFPDMHSFNRESFHLRKTGLMNPYDPNFAFFPSCVCLALSPVCQEHVFIMCDIFSRQI